MSGDPLFTFRMYWGRKQRGAARRSVLATVAIAARRVDPHPEWVIRGGAQGR